MDHDHHTHCRSFLAFALILGLASVSSAQVVIGFDGPQGSVGFGELFGGPAPDGFAPAAGRPVAAGHEDELERGEASPWIGRRITQLAHEIEEASRTLYHNYRAQSDTGNYLKKLSRAQAIASLRSLVESAEHFHRQAEGRWQEPEHTREDFRNLVRALDSAERIVPYAYRGERVRGELYRVGQLVEGLIRVYRRGGRGGGRWQYWEAVKQLAHTVDEKAEHAAEQLRRESHHGGYWERQAIADLDEFARKAEHFHHQLEDSLQNPDGRHTQSDYQELVWAFRRAQGSLAHAHPTEHVRRDFAEAARALRELARYYAPYDDDHGHGGPDHGHGDPDYGRERPGYGRPGYGRPGYGGPRHR